MVWQAPKPPRKPEAKAPTIQRIWQYGYRINETGVEWWGHVDVQYAGGNSVTKNQVIEKAQKDVSYAKTLGVDLTYTLLGRCHLTTTWSRFLPVQEIK